MTPAVLIIIMVITGSDWAGFYTEGGAPWDLPPPLPRIPSVVIVIICINRYIIL